MNKPKQELTFCPEGQDVGKSSFYITKDEPAVDPKFTTARGMISRIK